MSEPDNFDTDIDLESAQDEAGAEDLVPESAAESVPEKKGSGFFFKSVVVLVVLALGSGFFFLKGPGVEMLSGTATPEAPLGRAEAVHSPLPPMATESPVVQEKVAAAPMPLAIGTPQPAAPSQEISASESDPLSWEAPVTQVSTPVAMPEAPLMPAAVKPAVTEEKLADVTPSPGLDMTGAVQDAEKRKSGDKVAALEERLDGLEKMIAEFQADIVTKKDLESIELMIRKFQQEIPSEMAKPEGKKTKAPMPARRKKAVAASTKPKWILRSAKPDVAWISEAGSNELRTVSVGETLSGIGKVTSVAKNSEGRWVVNGTLGSISQ